MATVKKASKAPKKVNTPKKYARPSTPSYCSLVQIPPRVFAPEVGAPRAEMIIVTGRKWVNGTKLKYYFFNGGSDGSPASWKGDATQKNVVKQ